MWLSQIPVKVLDFSLKGFVIDIVSVQDMFHSPRELMAEFYFIFLLVLQFLKQFLQSLF